jgi:hypothetical protein
MIDPLPEPPTVCENCGGPRRATASAKLRGRGWCTKPECVSARNAALYESRHGPREPLDPEEIALIEKRRQRKAQRERITDLEARIRDLTAELTELRQEYFGPPPPPPKPSPEDMFS